MGSTGSKNAAPLSRVGTHEVWPMTRFSNEVVGAVYAATARRGNPVLAEASDAALLRRGIEMAAHAREHPCSYVATVDGEPVAVWYCWDCADEPTFTKDPGLAAHTELHHQMHVERNRRLGDLAGRRGYAIHCAYGGVVIGKPASVMLQMHHVCVRATWWAGYKLQYGAAVNPVTVRGAMLHPQELRWSIQFADVELADGSRPLAGKAPYRAVATLLPTWKQAAQAYVIPQSAIPFITAQGKKMMKGPKRDDGEVSVAELKSVEEAKEPEEEEDEEAEETEAAPSAESAAPISPASAAHAVVGVAEKPHSVPLVGAAKL